MPKPNRQYTNNEVFMDFKAAESTDGKVLIISTPRRLTTENSDGLKKLLKNYVDQGRYNIVINLAGTEYLDSKKTKSLSRLGEFRLQEIPSITIGRLAVQKEWQGKGIGRTIMFHIVDQALSTLGVAGVRLLLVQAKVNAFDFYEKMGFQFVKLTRKERQRIKTGSRTMFFDLTQLNDV